MSLYIDMKMIRPGNCSGSHCISVIMFWISSRIYNVVNPGNFCHSNSIGSPSIRSNSRHWDEVINQLIFLILPMHNTESENTQVSLLITELHGESTESFLFQELCCQSITDIPWICFLIPDQLFLSHRTSVLLCVVADFWLNVNSPNDRFQDELRLVERQS